jgi:hypothetical protein
MATKGLHACQLLLHQPLHVFSRGRLRMLLQCPSPPSHACSQREHASCSCINTPARFERGHVRMLLQQHPALSLAI